MSGGILIEGVDLKDFQRVMCEPEPTHECGLAVRDPLEWHWYCPDCGHEEHADDIRCRVVVDDTPYEDVGPEDEEVQCCCRSERSVLTLRPRGPFAGAVPRAIGPLVIGALALVSDVAGKKGMGG